MKPCSKCKEPHEESGGYCKLCMKAYMKIYHKDWYAKNKNNLKTKYLENIEERRVYQKAYSKTDSGKAAEKRHKSKPHVRAWINTRRRLKDFLHTLDSNHNKEVGCTKLEFKQYIEELFAPKMSWDNYGTSITDDPNECWEIDHITPVSKGGTNYYTNLQPLWRLDNIAKSDKLDWVK